MSDENTQGRYSPAAIPARESGHGSAAPLPQPKPDPHPAAAGEIFYEIEYDSSPYPGVGKFVEKPQRITPPEIDEKRELFKRMRALARTNPYAYGANSFFTRQVHRFNSAVFYEQGVFMKDFTDDYDKAVPLTQYFPFYQQMGYEQLRTYFTWRTAVRRGEVKDTSLSYAFLYIYELLSCIGADDPEDALEKLMSFWRAFRVFNQSADKYVLRWLKDFHIYYELPRDFRDFVGENGLGAHYPGLCEPRDSFTLFASVSKYNIRKSSFFTDGHDTLMRDCFNFTADRLRGLFAACGMDFEETVFKPTKKMPAWTPFEGALFYPWLKQRDRKVIMSEKEIYICRGNEWSFSAKLTSESGRALIGYIMKQSESALRRITGYKYKLTADLGKVSHEAVERLAAQGVSLEEEINRAAADFYREATKIVVSVDSGALSRIRREALVTQEKLTVPEQPDIAAPVTAAAVNPLPPTEAPKSTPPVPAPDVPPAETGSVWNSLTRALTQTELEALAALAAGETPLSGFAAGCGIMPEVLCDGINEKAADCIGDSILDGDFTVYDDYIDDIKKMVGCI